MEESIGARQRRDYFYATALRVMGGALNQQGWFTRALIKFTGFKLVQHSGHLLVQQTPSS